MAVEDPLPNSLPTVDADRFGGIARLYGTGALERLAAAHVAVVGVGGVGSWAVEALARSGVGRITLIDLDDLCVTNTNRQLPAMTGTIGRAKVEVMAERVRAIAPHTRVEAHVEFFTAETAPTLFDPGWTWAVDAIDDVDAKCLLLASCHQAGVPVVASGGAGGRIDPTQVRIADLSATGADPLLRRVRKILRREHGFRAFDGTPWGIPTVCSPERPRFPWSDGTVCERPELDVPSPLRLDCNSGFGTASFVTATFGFSAASHVVSAIAAPAAVRT